jgi:hypothetical protein
MAFFKKTQKTAKQTRSEREVRATAPPEQFQTAPFLHRLRTGQMKKLARLILVFSQKVTGIELRPYQEEFGYAVIYSVLTEDAEAVTALFARQSGKSETIAVVCVGLLVMLPILARYIQDERFKKFRKGFWIGIFGPSADQADTTYTRMQERLYCQTAAEILRDDEIGLEIDPDAKWKSVKLETGSFARCHSADIRARIESKTYHLLIIEEAQDVDPFVLKKSILPMGAATAATQVQIGTCSLYRSNFYDMILRNQRVEAKGGKKLHYQYDYQTAGKYSRAYRKYVEKQAEIIGFESDEFRLAYRLHWITERGMLVEPTLFESLGGDYFLVTYEKKETVAGIDVGQINSSTVITVVQPDYTKGVRIAEGDFRCHKRVLNWLDLRGDDYDQQFLQIVDFLRNYPGLRRIHIDATGVGRPLYDRLLNYYAYEIEQAQMWIINFEATASSNSDGILHLKSDLDSGRVTYPNGFRAKKVRKQQIFVEQLTSARKLMRGAYLALESDLDKDYVSSLMLASTGCDLTNQVVTVEERDVDLYHNYGLGRPNRYQQSRDRARFRM